MKKYPDDYVRTSVYFTPEGHRRVAALAKELGIAQAAMLEAFVSHAPKDILAQAVADFKAAKQRRRAVSRKLLTELGSVDPQTLREALEIAKSKSKA